MTDTLKRPWRLVAADLWEIYRAIVRECFPSQSTPFETFVNRAFLLSIHAAVVMLLFWWYLLGYAFIAIAKGLFR